MNITIKLGFLKLAVLWKKKKINFLDENSMGKLLKSLENVEEAKQLLEDYHEASNPAPVVPPVTNTRTIANSLPAASSTAKPKETPSTNSGVQTKLEFERPGPTTIDGKGDDEITPLMDSAMALKANNNVPSSFKNVTIVTAKNTPNYAPAVQTFIGLEGWMNNNKLKKDDLIVMTPSIVGPKIMVTTDSTNYQAVLMTSQLQGLDISEKFILEDPLFDDSITGVFEYVVSPLFDDLKLSGLYSPSVDVSEIKKVAIDHYAGVTPIDNFDYLYTSFLVNANVDGMVKRTDICDKYEDLFKFAPDICIPFDMISIGELLDGTYKDYVDLFRTTAFIDGVVFKTAKPTYSTYHPSVKLTLTK